MNLGYTSATGIKCLTIQVENFITVQNSLVNSKFAIVLWFLMPAVLVPINALRGSWPDR
jgi:hypothetical protein